MISVLRLLLLWLSLAGCVNASSTAGLVEVRDPIPLAFTNSGVRLSGTLWIPQGKGPFPAVVIIGGNGPWRPAYWYFDILRESFISRGIAVAYYDRRGEGGSEGDFDRASFADLAGDAVEATRAVASQTSIDSRNVGVWGHSMGGWIAGLAASQAPSIAFVITAAGPGVGPLEQTLHERANQDRSAGIPEATVLEMAALRRQIVEYYTWRTQQRFESAQASFAAARATFWFPLISGWRELQGVAAQLPSPDVLNRIDASDPDVLRWFRRDALYDPLPALSSINAPFLAIFGDADSVVPRDASIAALEHSFASSGRLSLLSTRSYLGANHMIMTGSGRGAESLANGYVTAMGDWILKNLRR